MTTEIANALFGYLETLYNLNQKLVKFFEKVFNEEDKGE